MTKEKDIRCVLVIKLGALGDVIQALGPMRAIRAAHRNAHITAMTSRAFVGLLEKTGLFDDIIIDKKPKWYDLLGWFNTQTLVNRGRYDRVYDLQNNDRTFMYLRLFDPRPEWVGAAPGASHRNTSPLRSAGHAFWGHVQTLALAGIYHVPQDDLGWMKGDITHLDLRMPYAVIVPGSAPQHTGKRWPYFASLCTSLVQEGIQPVLIGTEAESDAINEITKQEPQARSLVGQTKLWDLPALARGAAYIIGNDTGPMHLMGPTGVKTVVIMGGLSNPKRHYPLGANVHIIHKDVLADILPDQVLAQLHSFI